MIKDLVGKRFSSLTVVSDSGKRSSSGCVVWNCLCDCGEHTEAQGVWLKNGLKLHCSNCKATSTRERFTMHGGSYRPEYGVWKAMRGRCSRSTDASWNDYGARGIAVCSDWDSSFEKFFADMGECPPNYSLERVDVNGGYCPENCVWTDISTQNFNQRIRRNNTSSKTGVSWSEERGKWCAYIRKGGKTVSLGRFISFDEAKSAREQAELEIYGRVKE